MANVSGLDLHQYKNDSDARKKEQEQGILTEREKMMEGHQTLYKNLNNLLKKEEIKKKLLIPLFILMNMTPHHPKPNLYQESHM